MQRIRDLLQRIRACHRKAGPNTKRQGVLTRGWSSLTLRDAGPVTERLGLSQRRRSSHRDDDLSQRSGASHPRSRLSQRIRACYRKAGPPTYRQGVSKKGWSSLTVRAYHREARPKMSVNFNKLPFAATKFWLLKICLASERHCNVPALSESLMCSVMRGIFKFLILDKVP